VVHPPLDGQIVEKVANHFGSGRLSENSEIMLADCGLTPDRENREQYA
jgi:hypothetical protein